MGIMGYRTPNIDRIGREGAVFTDWYGQQSCTAGRAAFITGQSPIRTGLTKVGLPGAELGLGPLDPSVADVMKSLGYATGQFGKNRLGDRNEHLPTVMASTNFSAISITSTPRRSRRIPTIRKIRASARNSGRAAFSDARQATVTMRPPILPLDASASR
jgi:arylsulfatase A-like enzyme